MPIQGWVEYSGTHQLIFIISPFLTLHDGAVDVGNNGLRVRDVTLKLGNDDVGVGNGCIRVYCKFGLESDRSARIVRE